MDYSTRRPLNRPAPGPSGAPAPTGAAYRLQAALVGATGEVALIPVDLGYVPTDPYAVRMTFHSGERPVCWTFARDLLLAGLREPTGDGDVHVWPSPDEEHIVHVELDSPHGQALVRTDARDLRAFLDRTLGSVPLGDEHHHLDLDSCVTALLDRR